MTSAEVIRPFWHFRERKAVVYISFGSALAIGDVRQLGKGDVICVWPDAIRRADIGRYWDAVRVAWLRGAEVRMIGAGA